MRLEYVNPIAVIDRPGTSGCLSRGSRRAANGLFDFAALTLCPRSAECGVAERLPQRRELGPQALLLAR